MVTLVLSLGVQETAAHLHDLPELGTESKKSVASKVCRIQKKQRTGQLGKKA